MHTKNPEAIVPRRDLGFSLEWEVDERMDVVSRK
jgi:hypothetical protein